MSTVEAELAGDPQPTTTGWPPRPTASHVRCCDCGCLILAKAALSADPHDPPTADDRRRALYAGPVKGLWVCAERDLCAQALHKARWRRLILALKATKGLRRLSSSFL